MKSLTDKALILVGGGGHCKSVIDAALSAGFEVRGILDMPEKARTEVLGVEVVGTDDDVHKYVTDCRFVITVGQIKSAASRRRLAERIEAAGGEFATIVASTARVSPFARVGDGAVVLHGACVNADAVVGRHCIVNTCAVIEHDVEVGDFTHISTNSSVNGGAEIGDNCFIGSGTVVNQGVGVASGVVVASASLVNKSIRVAGIYAGVPVKRFCLR